MHTHSSHWPHPVRWAARLGISALALRALLAPGAAHAQQQHGSKQPQPAAATPQPPARATQGFRDEHVQVRKHLEHVRTWAGLLARQQPREQRATARRIVEFFQQHLGPHAAAEERGLYPLVDRLAGGGPHPFTASMRHAHRVVERWTRGLAQLAEQPAFNAHGFARETDRLLGLVEAHFEAEEDVLLPLVDAAMTREAFEREVGPAGHGGERP